VRYLALACDYDGTIATHGVVDTATLDALERLRASGRKLILVTGRHLDDLLTVMPRIELFDRVVVENGALLYRPESRQEHVLGEAPPERFLEMLRRRGVTATRGRVIVATWEPHETVVLETIRDLGLEHQVIFNKGAVMVLPPGVNKATGLEVALRELSLTRHETVGVGDAENDHAMLSMCECAVAVANALPTLKERADVVTLGDHGGGVSELCEQLLADDLAQIGPRLARHNVALGTRPDGTVVTLSPYGHNVLLAGPSGSGKSTLATGLIERLAERCYQIAILDPEGDYSDFEGAVSLGDPRRPPTSAEVEQVLADARTNAAVNLLGISLTDRPAFFADILPRLQAMRTRTGRPHWLIIDEAHHVIPSTSGLTGQTLPEELGRTLVITVHPSQVAPTLLARIDVVIAVGAAPGETFRELCEATGRAVPPLPAGDLEHGEALAWFADAAGPPERLRILPPTAERKRHHRKYTEGDLDDHSFYFRGPEGKLNLRAQNLVIFLQMAEGVDDDTWLYHLRQGDIARWFRDAIKDEELAADAERIARDQPSSAGESRALVREAIESRYTLAA